MFNLPTEYAEFNKPLELDKSAEERANNNSQFNAGTVLTSEAISKYELFFNLFHFEDKYSEEQRAYLLKRAGLWRDFITKGYNEQLRRRADFVPVNVAGGSKYNFEKFNKMADRNLAKAVEWSDKAQAFLDNTAKELDRLTPVEQILEDIRNGKRDETVTFDDPHAKDKLNAKLEYLTNKKSYMQGANKYFKKNKTLKGYADIGDERSEKLDKAIKDSMYGVPFPTFEITSLTGKIKRVQERINKLEAFKSDKAIKGFKFDGGEVIANYEADRLQIQFDEKPDEETRTLLKAYAFHWSSKLKVWQRQLNENALRAANAVLKGE